MNSEEKKKNENVGKSLSEIQKLLKTLLKGKGKM